jgi:cell division protease FtsH
MKWIRKIRGAIASGFKRAWKPWWGKVAIISVVLALLSGGSFWIYKAANVEDPECLVDTRVGDDLSCRMTNMQLQQILSDKDKAPATIRQIALWPLSQSFPSSPPIRVFMKSNGASADVYFSDASFRGRILDTATADGFKDLQVLPPLKPGLNWNELKTQAISIVFYVLVALLGIWIWQRGWLKKNGNKAKRLDKDKQGLITFADVDGLEDAKADLADIVAFLKEPEKFDIEDIPLGALLIGPPGGGKTLLARAVAGEANCPFFSISGSDFVEKFVGVGAERVREMFEEARKNAPCIIFVDEVDAVGRHRGDGLGNNNDEREQTLNQLLVEMDSFDGKDKTRPSVFLILATNRPDVLDPAFIRPGRCDRQIEVPYPEFVGRDNFLVREFAKIRAKAAANPKKPTIAKDVDTKKWARRTAGASPADLKNLVKEAKIRAVRQNRLVVTDDDFLQAHLKIQHGDKRALIMSDEEKRLTAYHEGGHATVALREMEKWAELVTMGTILPRRRALGMIQMLAQGDASTTMFGKVLAFLAVAMAGRAAEVLRAGGDISLVSSGAQGDIDMCTKIANAAIREYGFGPFVDPRLGFLKYGTSQAGSPYAAPREGMSLSSEVESWVCAAVKKLVDDGFNTAMGILSDKTGTEEWFAISEGLLEHETLSREQIIGYANDARTLHGNLHPQIELEPALFDGGTLTIEALRERVAKGKVTIDQFVANGWRRAKLPSTSSSRSEQ